MISRVRSRWRPRPISPLQRLGLGAVSQVGEDLGAEVRDVRQSAGAVAGAFNHENEVADAGALGRGGQRVEAVFGGAGAMPLSLS